MDKDLRIKTANNTETKDRETVIRLLSEGAEVSLPIDGKEEKVYWEKTGHADRTYYKAYIKSKILDAYNSGILQRYTEVEDIDIKQPARYIVPKHVSIVPESLKLTSDDEVISPDTYKYHNSVAVVDFIDKRVTGNFKLEYKYYDDESYKDFVDDFSEILMIYLSVRKIDNHDEKFFNNVKDVEVLTLQARNDIIDKYYKDIGVTEQDLKNLQTHSSSVQDEDSPKSTE